jgi:hypothetical protein
MQTVFQRPYIFRWGVDDDDSSPLPPAASQHVRFPLDESSCHVYLPSSQSSPPATASAPDADHPSEGELGHTAGTEWDGSTTGMQPTLSG